MDNGDNSAGQVDCGNISCEFAQNLDILRHVDFLAGLPMEALKLFALICSREKYQPGDYLFKQGENDGQAFYIVSGKALLTYTENNAEETLREVSAGQMLGGMAIMGDVPRLYSLKADTAMECFVLVRDKFNSTLVQFPEIMPILFKRLVQKVYDRERIFLETRNPDCQACRNNMGVVFA